MSKWYLTLASELLRLILFAASATAIVWAFAALGYRGITGRSLSSDWKQWSAQKRLLFVVGLLAVALSTRYWGLPVPYWPLWWLTWELKDLFFLVLVWFLANYLRKVSAEHNWLKLPSLARSAGVLLALFLFYSPTTRWN